MTMGASPVKVWVARQETAHPSIKDQMQYNQVMLQVHLKSIQK
jgi:hypothetical protein